MAEIEPGAVLVTKRMLSALRTCEQAWVLGSSCSIATCRVRAMCPIPHLTDSRTREVDVLVIGSAKLMAPAVKLLSCMAFWEVRRHHALTSAHTDIINQQCVAIGSQQQSLLSYRGV